jgi:hypothetical protein
MHPPNIVVVDLACVGFAFLSLSSSLVFIVGCVFTEQL